MGKTMKPDDFDQFVTDHGVCYTFKRSETDGKVSSPGKRTSGKKNPTKYREKFICNNN